MLSEDGGVIGEMERSEEVDEVGDTGESLRSEDPVEVCDGREAQHSEQVVDGGEIEDLDGIFIALAKASVGSGRRDGEAESDRSLRLLLGDMLSRS